MEYNNSEIPLGFGMALAQDVDAMNYFTNMSVAEQREIIDRTHSVTSKREMSNLVQNLKNKKSFI